MPIVNEKPTVARVAGSWSRVTLTGASLAAALAGCITQPGEHPGTYSPGSWSAVSRVPIPSNQPVSVSKDTVFSALGGGANYFVMFGPRLPGQRATGTPRNSAASWLQTVGVAYLVGSAPIATTLDVSIITKGTAIAIQIIPPVAPATIEIQRFYLLNPINTQAADVATLVAPIQQVTLQGVESFVECIVDRGTNTATLGQPAPVATASPDIQQFVLDIKARATAAGLPANTTAVMPLSEGGVP